LGNVGLQGHFVERDPQGRNGPPSRATRNGQGRTLTVEDAQALARVIESAAWWDRNRFIESCPIVSDAQLEISPNSHAAHYHCTCAGTPGNAMPDRVLDEVLQRKSRKRRVIQPRATCAETVGPSHVTRTC
jgi:hypothetical protein